MDGMRTFADYWDQAFQYKLTFRDKLFTKTDSTPISISGWLYAGDHNPAIHLSIYLHMRLSV